MTERSILLMSNRNPEFLTPAPRRQPPAISLIVWALALLLTGCASQSASESVAEDEPHDDAAEIVELSQEAMETAGIRMTRSRFMELRRTLETTGSVEADESRVAHIRPLSRGIIEKIYVRRGDRVGQGQPLVEYDNIELGELIGQFMSRQAELRQARTQQQVTLKFWERGRQLLEAQAIALKEVELRQAEYENASALVARAESERAAVEEKLHRFGLSDEDISQLPQDHAAHRTASHKTLNAPFPGVIIGYEVAAGELVDPGRELLTLADLSTVWVQASVYESDLGQIEQGQPAEVSSPAYPERTFQGRLTYIGDVLDRDTRTVKVRCVVPNPDRLLKLEMFVTVRIPSRQKQSGVAVPEEAIQVIDGQATVFIAEEPGLFRPRPVVRELSAEGWTIVTGLEEGLPLAAQGSFYLKSILKRESIGEEH